jgi:hypothetical protein
MTHPLQWFLDRIGKTVVVSSSTGSSETTINNESHAEKLHGLDQQILEWEFRAREFEGDGWKRLPDGTVNCGCKL